MKSKRPPWHLLSKIAEGRCIPALRLPVFDTTSPGAGGKLKPRKCASRESHPSEDLSELPPLLVAVAGQEYLTLTRSLRNSLSCCFVDGWVPLTALMASFMRINRTGGSWRILQSRFALVGRFARERISVAGYDRAGPVFVKVPERAFVLSLYIGNFFAFCTKKFFERIFRRRTNAFFFRYSRVITGIPLSLLSCRNVLRSSARNRE